MTGKEALKRHVKKVNRTLTDNDDLNTQKETISNLMKEVEFLLGGQEEKCIESFSEVIMAMANFDFSKRVKADESSSAITICLASALNMLCEEYQHSALPKNVLKNVLSSILLDVDLLVLTDVKGNITLVNVNKQSNVLPGMDEKNLYGHGINILFEDFDIIDSTLKGGGSQQNIPVELKWKGQIYPASLSLSISSNMGRMEAMIYKVNIQQ